MQSVRDILKKFDPLRDKYISREFQSFGVHLAQKLQDERRKSLYIRLAKTIHRTVLEEALRYVIDSNARNKAALFMWKLKELGAFKKDFKVVPKKKNKAPA
ncbi:hypothetical protein A2767_00830 [Candidatus Roizmanbacteria bacterium RIFCSPHIGHO2_01_FULL_35_10]|uniref:Uncharacterized protein n=1 Tax=Candidatus Roizmanbacteria bacterium RIFCSPLOWO2_01_FULL_35_13 TaxID=1802055 RepID=A0A1F7IDB4_9BACT|nr:MAG: hypothetical protein A2767_00830 [Candidatus Roizmanbacteria bacterium RIFCSPHIGHO2_01_FULL_35_10]OGK41347.1 MAG: hypothetical protein A3A74_03375 [Candidatus Roizmanbacteria bacterium RIFCSPLOWO2_01_FULL_35_13]